MSEYTIQIGEVTLSTSDMKQFYSAFNLDYPKLKCHATVVIIGGKHT